MLVLYSTILKGLFKDGYALLFIPVTKETVTHNSEMAFSTLNQKERENSNHLTQPLNHK